MKVSSALGVIGILVAVVVGGCSAQYLSGKWGDGQYIQYVVQRDTALFASLSIPGYWDRANGTVSRGLVSMTFYYPDTEITLNAVVQNFGMQVVWSNGIIWTKQQDNDLSILWNDDHGGQSIAVQRATTLFFGSTHPVTWARGQGKLDSKTRTVSSSFEDGTKPIGQVNDRAPWRITWDNGHLWYAQSCALQQSQAYLSPDGLWLDIDGTLNFLVTCGTPTTPPDVYAGNVNNPDFDHAIGQLVNNSLTMTFYSGANNQTISGIIREDGQTIQWDDSPQNLWKRVPDMNDLWIDRDHLGGPMKLNIIVADGDSLFFGYTIYKQQRETWTRGTGSRNGPNITASFDDGSNLTADCGIDGGASNKIVWSNGDVWVRAASLMP